MGTKTGFQPATTDAVTNLTLALEEANHRHYQQLERLEAAIYTCDADGLIKTYNKAAVALWGREPDIGKDLWCGSWKIFYPDGEQMPLDECPMAKVLKGKKPLPGETIVIERPDGLRRVVQPHPQPIYDLDGKLVEAINLLIDITELKQKETALKESEERYKNSALELEQRVQQRTEELEKANEALQRSNEDLKQFAFITSHDMQEPLRKINFYTKRVSTLAGEGLSNECIEAMEKIRASATKMSQLIKDVLQFSMLDDPSTAFVQTDLNAILAQVLSDMSESVMAKKAVVKVDALPVIEAVPYQMHQLFQNLLANSLKFTSPYREPHIQITATAPTDESKSRLKLSQPDRFIEIKVADNGIGFAQEYAEKIFQIFAHLNPANLYDGSGIGLAICKKIAANHKGYIYANAAEGEGTTVFVLLSRDL